ncbi:MAG TPA: FtsX-like permease family protein [Caulobacteraceae bacterium]
MPEAPLALVLAARELRAGVKGFGIFLACIALGVAAIAAAGSTAQAFRAGLASQARNILGGDLSVTVEQQAFSPAERATFARVGRVSYAVVARAMAQAGNGERRLVELRGVDGAYPLAGKVELAGAKSLREVLAAPDARPGAVIGAAVEQTLLDRLGLKLGERFLVGNSTFEARAILIAEPDRLSRGFALGPKVLTNYAAVQGGGFLSPGLLFSETARIAIPGGEALALGRRKLEAALNRDPLGAGFRIRDRNDAAPGLRHLIDQLEYFLGVIGLACLVAGGLGIFGAVNTHMEASKGAIAVLKVFGAHASMVRDVHLIRIALMATVGTGIGLAVGAAVPPVLGSLVAHSLPIPALFAVYPWPLVKAGAFGLLAAAAFSLIPLARARSTPPSVLLRRDVSGPPTLGAEVVAAGIAAVSLCALAVAGAPSPAAAAVMIGGVAASFALLAGLGAAAAWAAGRARTGARGPLRIGLANLAGPRSAARTAAPAIGIGVALVSAVILIQSSLLAQIETIAPRTAPALIFTDIPAGAGARFDAAVAQAFGRRMTVADYLRAPFATGRILKVRGQVIDRRRIDPSRRWAYDSDISLSAIGPQPAGADIVAGRWWPAAYRGPPLAALSVDAAQGAAVRVGDTIGLAVLGREIEARVAALRKVDFAGFGANFPVVLDPAALAGADLSEVAIAKASRAEEGRVTRSLGRDFREVNVISVRDQLEAAADLFGRLALTVRAIAGVAALAGVLVLAGSITAGAKDRSRDAAILKVLGATSAQILAAYAIEFGAVGVIAGVAGVGLGYVAAWPVVVKVFHASWSVDWSGIAALAGGAAILAGAGGVVAALGALAQRPAPVLRSP